MIDIHAHYDDEAFDSDRETLLTSLFCEHGVSKIINAGCNIESSLFSIELAEKYDGILCEENYHNALLDNLDSKDFPGLTYTRDLKDFRHFIRRTPDEYEN